MSENTGPGNERPVNRQHYFGACPECGDTNGYLNVGRSHWFVCDIHRTRWCAGSNLFSSWLDEDDEVWAANVKLLESCREVEPLPEEPDDSDEIEPADCMTDSSQGASAITETVAPDDGDDFEIPF
jgi:hypothetical protein